MQKSVCFRGIDRQAFEKAVAREELLSKLLGSIQSPIANFARVIKQIAENGGEVAEKAEEAVEAPAEEAVETTAE